MVSLVVATNLSLPLAICPSLSYREPMTVSKRHLSAANFGYSVSALQLLGKPCVIGATEGAGETNVFPLPDLQPAVLADGPGGCMGVVAVPGRDDTVLAITDFYPIFKGTGAGVDRYTATSTHASSGFSRPWTRARVMDLPFVHRIATVVAGGQSFLVAATVCSGKAYQDDWSQPGSVFVGRIPSDPADRWQLHSVIEGIHRNHGMNVGTYRGAECVLVAGTEGVFALRIPQHPDGRWEHEKILDHEVSEVFLCDFDRDGVDELAVIEPFHGDTFAVYKDRGSQWERVFDSELAFGHGLWAGELAGVPSAVVGNRSGSKDFVCFRADDTQPGAMRRTVIEAGTGTTNVAVLSVDGRQAIMASNQELGEYALYHVGQE